MKFLSSCRVTWIASILIQVWISSAFAPTIPLSSYVQSQTNRKNHAPLPVPSPTQLNWGVIVDVPDNFFTISGVTLGVAYTLTRSWNRVTVENISWETRLADARERKLEDQEENDFVGTDTELELRRKDAAVAKSVYGPEAAERRRKKQRVRVMEREEDEFDFDTEGGSRRYSMTDEQIAQFEEEFGIEYDPYYDEPYSGEELPEDMKYREDKVYGDRRYENGEIFYQDEEYKNLYWRQGGRPRLKQFWEFF